MNKKVAMIVATDTRGLIGNGDKLPWYIPDDMKHFWRVTQDKVVVMGRVTWQTLKKPLKNRLNVVVTRDTSFTTEYPEVIVVHSIEDALNHPQVLKNKADEIMIIGGAKIYEAAYPYATKLYMTTIMHEFEGDTYFPASCMGEGSKFVFGEMVSFKPFKRVDESSWEKLKPVIETTEHVDIVFSEIEIDDFTFAIINGEGEVQDWRNDKNFLMGEER